MSSTHRWMLVGSVEAGKSTLFKALLALDEAVRKTQAMDFYKGVIDTPGEFFSHPRLYRALINTAAEVETIVYVHAANDFEYRLPSGLLEVNKDKHLVAVITKIDLPDAQPDRVEAMIRSNGFEGDVFRICTTDAAQVAVLRDYLQIK